MVPSDHLDFRRAIGLDYQQYSPKLTGAVLRTYAPGTTIFVANTEISRTLFIKSGWVVSSKTMANGTRIVTDFSLQGDLVSSVSASMAQETVQAISNVQCFEFGEHLSAKSSEASSQLTLIMMIEMMKRHGRIVERLASIGRRDAFGRTGHLLLELAVRARGTSRSELDGFECPLKQSEIGDALGLSTVHINRVLKEMRLAGLLSFRNGIVEFLNRRKLEDLVDFDDSYLIGGSLPGTDR